MLTNDQARPVPQTEFAGPQLTFDLPGLQIGVAEYAEGPTGCSRNDADLIPWEPEERLELPVHQIVAQCPGAAPPEFEFFLNEVWENEWQFRKERSIRRPLTESYLQTAQGIPVLAPELQLLYKATLHRPKDEHDFQTALGYLRPDQRAWLKQALESFRPGDAWLDALT